MGAMLVNFEFHALEARVLAHCRDVFVGLSDGPRNRPIQPLVGDDDSALQAEPAAKREVAGGEKRRIVDRDELVVQQNAKRERIGQLRLIVASAKAKCCESEEAHRQRPDRNGLRNRENVVHSHR